MNTALTVIALLCVFGLPVPIVMLTRKSKILGGIGAIACCYIVGFAFSTIGLSGVSYDKNLTTTVAYVLVALSIPLILFSIDLREIKKLTKSTIIGYTLCIVSVLIVSFGMFFVTRPFFDGTNYSAMIVGLYTGGTPNMNAIGAAMGADSSVLGAANLSDTLVGGLYFLLLISVVPKIYTAALGNKKKSKRGAKGKQVTAIEQAATNEQITASEQAATNEQITASEQAATNEQITASEQAATNEQITASEQVATGEQSVNVEQVIAIEQTATGEQTVTGESGANGSEEVKKHDDFYFGISIRDKKSILKLIGAFLLSVGCVGVGAALELLIEGTVGENLLYILLSVSVLGVVFSFLRPVREIKGEYSLGMYLILMFSLALSMSIDWTVFISDIAPTLLFFAVAQISVILLHFLLCFIFRIDGGTAVITSTAGVYGPPFIAPVANAAKRPDLIAPGVICGALGLAIGTLLGIGAGNIFLLF